MKVTPLEIRQKSFEKNFRGYDKDEVNAFLLTLSQEWERVIDENKELRIKLEAAEKEVLKLREVENSLFKTLKTAEDTGASVVEQARQAADLHLKESRMKAEVVLSEAKTKAKTTIEEAETRARNVLATMDERVKELAEAYRKVEAQRDNLLTEMRHLAEDTMERINRVKKVSNGVDIDRHVVEIREQINKVLSPNGEHHAEMENDSAPSQKARQTVLEETSTQPLKKSFFDEIE